MSATVAQRGTRIQSQLRSLRTHPGGLVAILTVGVLVLRVSQMHQSLYGDEVFTYQDLAGRGLGAVLRTVHTGGENSPPLFFVLAWLAAKLGDPTVLIRLPSLICSTATIPLVYRLGRETFGSRAGLIGATLMGVSAYSTFYGIEARPYATMAFFVVLSTLALLHAVRSGSRRWWLAYALTATAAAYTHYTAVFILAAQGLWSLWVCRKRPLEPLLAGALGVVLYIPWIGHVRGKSLDVIGALEPLNLQHVVTDLPRPITGYPYASLTQIPTAAGLVVVLGAAALGGWCMLRSRGVSRPMGEGAPARLLIALLAVATPVGLLLYSIVASDLWLARGLYASVPAQALVLGALLGAIEATTGLVALAAVLITLAFGAVRSLSHSYRRPAFRAAAAYLDRVAAPNDPVIFYRSIVDAAIPVQFSRRHVVRYASPTQWAGIPVGGRAFVVIDDDEQALYHLSLPHPAGFRLLARRHYTGLLWFSVVSYLRVSR